MPTEAEWEYACRGGSTAEYYWGDIMDDSYCWNITNADNKVHTVGQKKPNGFGLYDMSGNVSEWCWNWDGDYSPEYVKNPTGPSSGWNRIKRGGDWNRAAVSCQSASRACSTPGSGSCCGSTGFRLVKSAPIGDL